MNSTSDRVILVNEESPGTILLTAPESDVAMEGHTGRPTFGEIRLPWP